MYDSEKERRRLSVGDGIEAVFTHPAVIVGRNIVVGCGDFVQVQQIIQIDSLKPFSSNFLNLLGAFHWHHLVVMSFWIGKFTTVCVEKFTFFQLQHQGLQQYR